MYYLHYITLQVVDEKEEYSTQRLLLGTHTSNGEPNLLMVAQVTLPLEDTPIDARTYAQDEKVKFHTYPFLFFSYSIVY